MVFTEGPKVELKRRYVESVRKEIVAFANAEGGVLYLGVEDDGEVCGLDDPCMVEGQVNSVIHDAIAPDLSMFAEARVEQVEDVGIVVVEVQRGPDRPYYLKNKGLLPEGVFVRQGTCAQPLPRDGIRAMIRETCRDSFEQARSLNQCLTFSSAQKIFSDAEIEFGENQMRTLGIKGADGVFSNLAYLLSDQCAVGLKIAKFEGDGKNEFVTRREYEGSILSQILDALEFLDMANNVRAWFSGKPERTEVRDYPPVAIRETLLNALVHRDYGIAGPVIVNLYESSCEMVSPGSLAPGVTRESALAGVSVSRNPGLASVLYRLHWIEAFGTGIRKTRDGYVGFSRKPDYEFLDGAVKVTLPNMNAETSGPASQVRYYVASFHELGPDQRVVMDALDPGVAISKKEAAARTGFSEPKTARILKELSEKGHLRTYGNTRGKRYEKPSDGSS